MPYQICVRRAGKRVRLVTEQERGGGIGAGRLVLCEECSSRLLDCVCNIGELFYVGDSWLAIEHGCWWGFLSVIYGSLPG